jgi:hypothetical protein
MTINIYILILLFSYSINFISEDDKPCGIKFNMIQTLCVYVGSTPIIQQHNPTVQSHHLIVDLIT